MPKPSSPTSGAYVVFDDHYCDADLNQILEAIKMVKGVKAVESKEFVVDHKEWMARHQLGAHLFERIADLTYLAVFDKPRPGAKTANLAEYFATLSKKLAGPE